MNPSPLEGEGQANGVSQGGGPERQRPLIRLADARHLLPQGEKEC